MKKLFITILLFAFTFSLNAQEMKSDQTIQVGEWVKSKYSKLPITFGGKYNETIYKIKSKEDYIYMTQSALLQMRKTYLEAYDKAVEWMELAKSNNVKKLEKEMTLSFKTSGGMIEDSGYEIVGVSKAKFNVSFWYDKYDSIQNYELYCKIFQADKHYVRASSFWFPYVRLNDSTSVKEFERVMEIILNSKENTLKSISETKSELFKN